MTANEIRTSLLAERAALEATIATLLAGFTEQTGLVVTRIRLADGAVECRVELGRDEARAIGEPDCCAHVPGGHNREGCWANVGTGSTFERCPCRTPSPARTATDI